MYQLSSPPILLGDITAQIGHSLQTISSGTNVLALVQLNFG